MAIEERNQLVINYINNNKINFEKSGIKIPKETVRNLINKYISSNKSFEEIKQEIDEMVEEKQEDRRKRLVLLAKVEKNTTKITDLDIENIGITLNEQDIDLMMIGSATTPAELKITLEDITNISIDISDVEMDEAQFQQLRQQVFDSYMESLTSRNEYYATPGIQLSKKIEYLRNSGIFSPEELHTFDSSLQSGDINQIIDNFNKPFSKEKLHQIIDNLRKTFSKEKLHQIFQTMKDYSPIEKVGVIGTDIETYQRMFQEVNSNYTSITIDESAKYGNVALPDGTFDFSHLQKTLDFAKTNGKQVRLNTLLFYMDCPDNLYNLPVTEENKQRVKQVLSNYVEQITSFIKDNGYDSTVRSIDVFNELLNRFAMDGDVPYQYRGVISQDPNVKNFDNIKSGWLKFLNIEDLCDVIAIARKNLPETDFMYNDDNLIDSRKIPATTEILKRIRQYEIDHGIRLIDSIGTQMHIDNSVTKDQVITMFHALGKYGLPIEVTEFDMAMISNIDGLSEDEINNLRVQKMQDFFDAVTKCRETDSIRGFTIWSKTDAQNFRVALENEQRIKNRQEPITTLHGGFYNNDMSEKKSKSKEKFQDFNYHTHTYRSGHSEYVSDKEILESARQAGISMLGFSEHIPNTDLELPDEDHRMLRSEVDNYIESINKLKKENPDMTILVGFEAEFDPMKGTFLGEMREKVDYMILGQHFVKNGIQMVPQKGNQNYPLEYAKMVCKGIESGLFDIVAHPDHFMSLRDTIRGDNQAIYKENCIKATHMICQKAAEIGIPLEINLSPALNNQILHDENLAYPHPLFWKIANDYDIKVVKGIDAHSISAFQNLDKGQELITNIEQMVSNKMIKGQYNPIIERQNNQKLQGAYKSHQEELLTYETHLVSQIINNTLETISNDQDSESLAMALETSLNRSMQRCVADASMKEKSTTEEMSTILDSQELSTKDKKLKLERKKKAIIEAKQVLENQRRAIERAKNNVINAANIGCENKNEYSAIITQMTQHQTTKSEIQKMQIEQNLSSFKNSKTNQTTNTQSIDKPKVMKKANNNQGYNTSFNGFVNIITLSMIIILVCSILLIIVYTLINR